MRYQDLDIVTRLRNEQDALDTEAADEIERLRAALREIADDDEDYYHRVREYRQIARAALGERQ